ncbi:acyl carrier protein [Paenibacillus sp. CF095]|uniref:acyl carrier protein n=1 Tax=Paenibacillus sp. CF095 TaxID=1881033 RepID=UPI00087EA575|nr:acyl carrier protein [Paenibacillus sp. CF095]SDD50563.1 acyl carrier protein [Paenibacillus sp. CF095]
MDSIKEKLINIARNLDSSRMDNSDSDIWKTSLLDLGINSIEYVHFIVEIEQKLGMELPDQLLNFNEFNTLEKIGGFISELSRD